MCGPSLVHGGVWSEKVTANTWGKQCTSLHPRIMFCSKSYMKEFEGICFEKICFAFFKNSVWNIFAISKELKSCNYACHDWQRE